jgi:predicted nuclease of predicted toxin-antitoxin system
VRSLLDESAELRLAAFLRQAGHDVTSIVQDHPRSLPDEQVLEIAKAERRILITNDRDFGELSFRQQLPHAGVIYFRLPLDSTADEKITWLTRLLSDDADRLDQFITVRSSGVRAARTGA